MTGKWLAVREKDRYGIAIHNYQQEDKPMRIKLTVGECVQVLEENADWFFGFTTKNRGLRGIFPRCYVRIMDSVVDRSGPTDVTVLKQPYIVQELTSVLREWGVIWKHLYVTHNENFKTIEHRMYELVRYRSQILSGTLPVDELKQVKKLVTSKIDMGNKLLGLDMVVRDEHGNILNPEQTSTIQLYWQHELATERIRKATSEPMNKKIVRPASQQLTQTLFVSVRNFVCKMSEDAELLMTLYDGKENKAFTENYVVRWSKDGLARDIDQLHNLRVLFTDLGSRDLSREKVYLVCYVVRLGGMDTKEPEKENKRGGRSSITKVPNINADTLRRPFGVAAIDITLYVAGKLETDEDKHHFLPFLPCDKDNLEGTLRKILVLKELTQREHKGQGLYCSFKMLHGDIKQVREENPHLVLGQVATARKMGFPEIILPGDVRNDLYLTLVCGEFSKGSKSTDKNVEVTVRVCNENGVPLQVFPGMTENTTYILLVIILGVAIASVQNEFPLEGGVLYPRSSETRQVIKLDGIWNFRQDSDPQKGIEEKWFKDDLANSGPVILMPVPSSYNDITQDKSLRDHVGVVWYDRRFFVPDTWEKEGFRVWLRFSSVHYFAQVWVNGKKVVEHEFGHLPFQAEVTNILKFGKENRVTVYVDNVLTIDTIPQGCLDKIQTESGSKIIQRYSFDFFNYAGIHRSVFLYTTPKLYIDDISLNTDISGSSAYVNYNVSYKGTTGSSKELLNLTVDIWDVDDVSQCFETVTIENGGPGGGFVTGRIEITNAKFWWPYLMDEEPGYLYTLRVSLKSSETNIEDIYYLPFGARTIKWSDTSLLINGKPIYIRGFGRHEDADIRGKGLDLVIAVKDYNLLKWIGANAYRTSHYPYAEELMDLADQQGIMIIDECASVNTENFTQTLLKKHKLAMAETIRRDKNRPSVIMWSVANEPRTADKESGPYFGSVVAFTRKLDKTRPITAVLNRWFTVDQAGQHMDIISFNRYNSWYTEPGETETIRIAVESEAENWHKKYKKPVIMSEYGVDTLVGLHANPERVWTEEYLEKVLSEHFKAFDNLRKKKFFIGEMIWNFADFMTDQAITRVGGNRKGIFTRQRQPKCAAHLVRIRYFQLAKFLNKAESPPDLLTYTFSEKGHSEL